MYAILEVGGRQYKVAPKDVIEVNKLDAAKGEKVTFDKVLMVSDDKKIDIGRPYVAGAKIEAEVLDVCKGKKLTVYKYLRRKDSHKKTGHRQSLTKLLINKINK